LKHKIEKTEPTTAIKQHKIKCGPKSTISWELILAELRMYHISTKSFLS